MERGVPLRIFDGYDLVGCSMKGAIRLAPTLLTSNQTQTEKSNCCAGFVITIYHIFVFIVIRHD